jgi:hypothetical protein
MKGILPSLAGLMVCASTLHSGAADPEGFLQSKTAEEFTRLSRRAGHHRHVARGPQDLV